MKAKVIESRKSVDIKPLIDFYVDKLIAKEIIRKDSTIESEVIVTNE